MKHQKMPNIHKKMPVTRNYFYHGWDLQGKAGREQDAEKGVRFT